MANSLSKKECAALAKRFVRQAIRSLERLAIRECSVDQETFGECQDHLGGAWTEHTFRVLGHDGKGEVTFSMTRRVAVKKKRKARK